MLNDYDEHDRIHTAITPSDGRRQIVSRWWDLRSDGRDVAMFAATNESVTELDRATSPAEAIDVLSDALQRRWVDEPAIEYLPPAEIGLD